MIFLGLESKQSRSRTIRDFVRRMSYAGIIATAALLSGCSVFNQIKTDFGQLKDDVKAAISSEPAPNTAQRTAGQTAPNTPQRTATQTTPNTPQRTAAQMALNEGIELYDKGDFNAAIRRLSNSSEIWSSDKSIQTKALKYMAFSYCVTSRKTLCKQQFEKALKIDPHFDLAPGEKGHPLWGSVFERAKKSG